MSAPTPDYWICGPCGLNTAAMPDPTIRPTGACPRCAHDDWWGAVAIKPMPYRTKLFTDASLRALNEICGNTVSSSPEEVLVDALEAIATLGVVNDLEGAVWEANNALRIYKERLAGKPQTPPAG